MNRQLVELPIVTSDGVFIARYTETGLAELNFPNAKVVAAGKRSEGGLVGRASSRAGGKSEIPAQIRAWHRTTESALKKILGGTEPEKFPPFDAAGTDFQKSVWREMRKIPLGRTKSYGEVAKAIGKPKAVRAVGGACGANPIPVLIPCHRVLAANKKLGGFSGGLDWKRKLLSREGIKMES